MFTSMSAARTGNVTGARYRRLGLAGQDAFAGGIYYAATDLEARQCRVRVKANHDRVRDLRNAAA
jgi:hypothetical protein